MVSTQDQQDQLERQAEEQEAPPEQAIPSHVVLKLDHVTKSFGQVEAVKDASLEVHRGEILTLLGPGGSGKTTMLRMAVGLERPTSGDIYYGGRPVDATSRHVFVPPYRRNMGLVFQSYAVWPHMTVFENVAYPLRARRVKAQELRERVGQVLEQVGLTGYEQRSSATLSAGQQQRVAIARALVFEPDILLLDNPFGNLDPKLREQMRADLRLLQQRLSLTVLFATRDQTEALCLSDRVMVMDQGSIAQVGTPRELYRQPMTAAVRDLLGRTIMLRGQVLYRDPSSGVTVRLQDESGPTVLARHVASDSLTQGDPCAIAIRPESIHVSPVSSALTSHSNAVSAKLLTLLFLGDRYEAAVELPWGQHILIDLPPTDDWRVGQEITIHLPAEDVRVWPV